MQKIDKGTVKPSTLVEHTFTLQDKKVKRIKKSCSCFTSTADDNKLKISFTTSKIPYHLKQTQNYYFENKTVNITYEDDTTETLLLKCKVQE